MSCKTLQQHYCVYIIAFKNVVETTTDNLDSDLNEVTVQKVKTLFQKTSRLSFGFEVHDT